MQLCVYAAGNKHHTYECVHSLCSAAGHWLCRVYPEDGAVVRRAAEDAAVVEAEPGGGDSVTVSPQHLYWHLQTRRHVRLTCPISERNMAPACIVQIL